MVPFACVKCKPVDEILEALGLTGQPIVSLQLTLAVCEVATVSIVRQMSTDEAEKIAAIATKYELHLGDEIAEQQDTQQ